jgi:hypothetical protein
MSSREQYPSNAGEPRDRRARRDAGASRDPRDRGGLGGRIGIGRARAGRRSGGPRAVVDALYAALDPLAHPARARALAVWARELAREQAGDTADASGIRPYLDELDVRDPYGRRLAVLAATIVGDVDFLEARLTDPDAAVRATALSAASSLPISDDALELAMRDAPAAVRRRIARAVVAGRRSALAERLVASLADTWGDEEAARLLPACGAETVRVLLPRLFPAVTRWHALGRAHPDLLLDEVARQLADLPAQLRTTWWARNADVFAATARARPHRVLDLLEAHCPPHLPAPVRDCLGVLLKAAPGRTIALVIAPDRSTAPARGLFSRSALGRLARAGTPELADLGRAWRDTPDSLVLLLRALPPSRREAFYDTVTAGQDLSRSSLADAVLDALPRWRAQAEARRMAAQADERGASWDAALAPVAYLPVTEARPRLLAATRRPAAEDRAVAYPLLVRNAARSGEAAAVAVLLEDLQRLRNEQEPVRGPALDTLAKVPPSLFADADTALLDRIAVDAIEARDSSYRTRRALSDLALAVLREHAVGGGQPLVAWALTTLTRLSGHTGGADLGRLHTMLRRGQEFQVFDALRPWLDAGAKKADHSLALSLARALGRRAHHMPQLQELLWQAFRSGGVTTARQAVDLWLDDPSARDARVARVLDVDRSAAVLAPVLRVLTRRRTDLLDIVLGDTPPYGRFLVADSRWLPPVADSARWLPRQQAAAARLLARAADDASLPKHTRAAHIRAAATIPAHGADIARRYAGSPDTVLAEAALGALAWTDRPADALPLLLAHAGHDRARVALYATTRVSRFVAPTELERELRAVLLPGALAEVTDATPGTSPAATPGAAHSTETLASSDSVTPVAPPGTAPTAGGALATDRTPGAGRAPAEPTAKVTSRKELVRLAASRLPIDTAAAVVAEAYALPGQHPDVRAACVPAAVGLLRAPAARQLLERAVDGPPVVQAAVLRVQPYDLQDGDRPAYARLVGRVADSSDTETADSATTQLARWAPWYPEAAALLLARVVDLDRRSAWRAAAAGLVALTAAPEGDAPLLDALTRLTTADAEAAARGLDADADRDRPARQRVDHLVARLAAGATMGATAHHREAALRASELLSRTPDFVPHGTRLQAAALDFDAPPTRLHAALDQLATLHIDRPALAARTAETLRHRLSTARRPGRPEILLTAVDHLTATPHHATGLFAVALTHALGVRTGWPPAWRARLRTLRVHPDPDVRDAALAVSTTTE